MIGNLSSIRDLVTLRKALGEQNKSIRQIQASSVSRRELLWLSFQAAGAATQITGVFSGVLLSSSALVFPYNVSFRRALFITSHSGASDPGVWTLQSTYEDLGGGYTTDLAILWNPDGSRRITTVDFVDNSLAALRGIQFTIAGASATNPVVLCCLEHDITFPVE